MTMHLGPRVSTKFCIIPHVPSQTRHCILTFYKKCFKMIKGGFLGKVLLQTQAISQCSLRFQQNTPDVCLSGLVVRISTNVPESLVLVLYLIRVRELLLSFQLCTSTYRNETTFLQDHGATQNIMCQNKITHSADKQLQQMQTDLS